MDRFLKVITAIGVAMTAVGILSGNLVVVSATAGGCVAGIVLSLWKLKDSSFLVWLVLQSTMGGAAGCIAGVVIESCLRVF